jgi:hypothetical protein
MVEEMMGTMSHLLSSLDPWVERKDGKNREGRMAVNGNSVDGGKEEKRKRGKREGRNTTGGGEKQGRALEN